jgi:predicted amidohydrolase
MSTWTIAAVQMDCQFGDRAANLRAINARLVEAAEGGAKLVIFPECILSGYGFESREEAWPHTETLPGPSTEALTDTCRRFGVFCVYGLLEKEPTTGKLFNACALVGPDGFIASYRKIHLPVLGVDRFTTPGDRPFAVHDLGGLRLGMNICYDASFPESSRVLALLGADLIVLPTNWPTGAMKVMQYLAPARALENHVFYAGVNRIGEEAGFRFIGRSRIFDCSGNIIAASDDERETILYATIEPEKARNKHVIFSPGRYEVDRVRHRRPEMYAPLTQPPR